jgi:hypothetical protein
MHRMLSHRGLGALPALVLLCLPVAGAKPVPSGSAYTAKQIVQIGQKAGDVQLPSAADHRFYVGTLSDNGQIAFGVGPSLGHRFYQGGYQTAKPDWLFHYARGKFTPIVAPGIGGPAGSWPGDVGIMWPFGMNRSGNIAFSAASHGKAMGTFVWDASDNLLLTVAQQGMPAPDGGRRLTFDQPGGFGSTINDSNEIVWMASVKDPNGPDGPGLFFYGRDGKTHPILLPGQTLSGGARIIGTHFPQPSINESGAVAFLARRQGESHASAFRWESGELTPMALHGAAVPNGTIRAVTGVFLNSRNNNALLTADVTPTAPATGVQRGVYRWVDGTLKPLLVPGQRTPDGGRFRSLQNVFTASVYPAAYDQATICLGVSAANRYAEHVVLAFLEDGKTAAYRVDTAGSIRPILKSGTVTNLGTITSVGVESPASINQYGQIALSVRINNGPPTLVLLSQES